MKFVRMALPALTVAAAVLVGAPPASADITVDSAVCLHNAAGTVSWTNPTVAWPGQAVLSSTANLPTACSAANARLLLVQGLTEISLQNGSAPVPTSGLWFLRLRTSMGDTALASVSVSVNQPEPRSAPSNITITSNDFAQRRDFVASVRTPGSTVTVAGNVNLDLSGLDEVRIADHVRILGDRSVVRSGPRLFTTTFPRRLFVIGSDAAPSDGVRISGIRLDGGMSDDAWTAVDKSDTNGIEVHGSVAEIDHNELYHWRGEAVGVSDGNTTNAPTHVGRLNQANARDAWVHDNYIHHNQHPSSADCGLGGGHATGYGVVVSDGAYATIERNVFDYNRHSIAGDGSWGTGYFANDNLILQHGGDHIKCQFDEDSLTGFLQNPFRVITWIGVQALSSDGIYHTHAIDMHGQDKCVRVNELDFSEYNCGVAGEYMELSYNTVLYTAGNGIHLRGHPALQPNAPAGTKYGMYLSHNVFAHSEHDGGFPTPGAVVLNDGGFDETATTLGHDTFNDRKYCDFDGDTVSDPFIATGATWWYASSLMGGRWVFLNRSSAPVARITLSDVDGDRRCDATADGHTVLNPDPQPLALSPGDRSTAYGDTVALDLLASGGMRPYRWTVTGLPSGLSATSAGHVSGGATGAPNSTVTATVTDAGGRSSTTTFTWRLTATVPDVRTVYQSEAQSTLAAAGLSSLAKNINSCNDPGTVQSQSPSPGTTVPIGTQVTIDVAVCPSGHKPL